MKLILERSYAYIEDTFPKDMEQNLESALWGIANFLKVIVFPSFWISCFLRLDEVDITGVQIKYFVLAEDSRLGFLLANSLQLLSPCEQQIKPLNLSKPL